MAKADVKSLFYAWCGKKKLTPEYEVRPCEPKYRQRFRCELKELQSRQSMLLAAQKDVETKLANGQATDMEGAYATANPPSSMPAALSAQAAESSVASTATNTPSEPEDTQHPRWWGGPSSPSSSNLPEELKSLRQQLQYLKSVYDIKDQCRLECYDYVACGNSTNKKDAQSNAAEDFLQYLAPKEEINES